MNAPSLPLVNPRHFIQITCLVFALGGQVSSAQESVPESAPVTTEHNFARGLSGASALVQYEKGGDFIPDQQISSLIDDDVSSGWAPPVGETQILIRLAQAADIKNLTLYAPDANGSYSIYVASSEESLAAGDLELLADDLSLAAGAQTSLDDITSLYVVIVLDVIESAPIRHILITGAPSSGALATTMVISPGGSSESEGPAKEGEVAEVNFALKELGAALAEGEESRTSDALIDGDTATSTTLSPDENGNTGTTVQLASAVDIDRITLSVGSAFGEVTIYASAEDGTRGRMLFTTQLDGSAQALSFDIGGVRAEYIQLDWKPNTPGTPLVVNEVGIFALARVQRVPANPGAAGEIVINQPSTPSPGTNPSTISDSSGVSNTPPPPATTPNEPRAVSG